jgi:hypothetical protein
MIHFDAYRDSFLSLTRSFTKAVYHASGKRVRDLPITAEKLL